MHWKSRGRLSGALLLIGAFASANHTLVSGTAAASDPAIPEGIVQAHLHDAENAARQHVDRFLARAFEKDGAAIKVNVSDGQISEAVWISDLAMTSDGISGIITNTPRFLPDLKSGDPVQISSSEIRDWSFIGRDGKVYGNYTTRTLLPRLKNAQAAQVAAILSHSPTPAGWRTTATKYPPSGQFSLAAGLRTE